ncbi:hypothetical protein RB595_009633 [Gaeumannomyces hyphopodioides]
MTSTPDPNPCNQKVVAFLEEYEKAETQKQFKDFADHTRRKCEVLLEDMKIKGVVQSRSKGYDSLAAKLNSMAKTPEFMDWVAGVDNGNGGEARAAKTPDSRARLSGKGINLSGESSASEDDAEGVGGHHHKKGRSIYEHPDMGDLAGVRIGLFFPGDIPKVAQKINETFSVSYTFGTVTDTTRSAVDGRNRDIQQQGSGRWVSQGPGEDAHNWEHYGYKSWQVVVGWKTPLSGDLKSAGEAPALTQVFGSLRAEIQVGTVVTQAWAEVQHNIIYKKSADIQATPTMKRMIDAINGLAITTDIMLTELERCQTEAEKEVEEKRKFEKEAPLIALESASLNGDHETVKRLLEDGVNANAKGRNGWTALHLASMQGHDKVVELLVKNGIDVNAEDEEGDTALHLASAQGYDKVVAELLVKNGVDVNAENNFGSTAYDGAFQEGHDKAMELLVKNGADINAGGGIWKTGR